MRIRRIYRGENPIRRVYQNGRLIQRYDNSIILWGKTENDTILFASLLPVRAIVIEPSATSESETAAPLIVCGIVQEPGIAEASTEVDGAATALFVVSMAAEAKSINYTKAIGYADRFVRLGPVNVTSKSDAEAQAYSNRVALAAGETHSNTEALTEFLSVCNPHPFEAETIGFAYAKSAASIVGDKHIGSGSSESTSGGGGNLTLWRYSFVVDGTLEIESAYGASVTNGILEVI